MLQLFNYDLQKPVKNYPALQRGVEKIGGGIHILNGPWIIDTGKSPQNVLDAVNTSLKAAAQLTGKKNGRDKLLVFPVQMGEISQGSTPPHYQPIERHPGVRVLAVSYHFRNSPGETAASSSTEDRREALLAALLRLGETRHPLNALCFVKTDQSAHEVRLALVHAVPLTPSDELVVAEVDMEAKLDGRPVKGAEKGLTPEHHDWLVKAGVL